MGGLGNQLFQIFATLASAIKFNMHAIFTYDDILTIGRARNTYWNSFLDKLKQVTTINKEIGLTNADLLSFPRYHEGGFEFQQFPFFNENVMLYGYFQSYKYFEQYRTAIFSIIDLENKKTKILDKYNDMFMNSSIENVSMHFRLGDYKNIQHVHPLMPYEYYKNSIYHILSNVESLNINVLYFCEQEDNADVSITINKLKKDFPDVVFNKVNDDATDWEQMLLMSCCNHNIIANSSFSWWGGYFNSNDKKIVCYPYIWFGPANRANVNDLFPPNWTKIMW
jgi:hypothetical protein